MLCHTVRRSAKMHAIVSFKSRFNSTRRGYLYTVRNVLRFIRYNIMGVRAVIGDTSNEGIEYPTNG